MILQLRIALMTVRCKRWVCIPQDTDNTLRYANRAKDIRLKSTCNVTSVDYHVSEYKGVINRLQKEVADLRAQLAAGNVLCMPWSLRFWAAAAPCTRAYPPPPLCTHVHYYIEASNPQCAANFAL